MKIGFVGLGNMGLPMAKNIMAANYSVCGYDKDDQKIADARANGLDCAADLLACVSGVDVVITMLPNGEIVEQIFMQNDVLSDPRKLIIDCSTIDITVARKINQLAQDAGVMWLDAPVSGGMVGAQNASLTFMCGGDAKAMEIAQPILQSMGAKIVHCGDAGAGQAAKMCNNMMLGTQMIAVCEGFRLACDIGLDPQKLFEVSSQSSAQCWALNTYCPYPGLVQNAPSSNGYKAGFSAGLMAKDMRLALDACDSNDTKATMARLALGLYEEYVAKNGADGDFSGIFNS